ncbi:Protein involved in meta-pathway of phenol degradation [Lysobacter dokdonensis DS-58]|uniref:Protein involved in meta-pathway of phenol degradation n=1 Tax=Lysobacter dokdonensis DS-58 TaxID=1300345 RepID=A0A0A2WMB4_9GAMM|nr:transporter [Lysobacter dokdonensis]KGQ19430.1 Protein involved in meta-pathway of phenol degradation [Lysobacter dokdonensis DS-58]
MPSARSLPLVAALVAAFACVPAHATEGGLGKPITGLQGQSYAGVVPPTPGFNLAIGYAYYSGQIGGQRETPIGRSTAIGVDAQFSLLSFTGLYVWPTGEGRWNYASAVAVPFAKVDVGADLRIGRIGLSTDDSDSGLFDMTIVPVIASRHFSQTKHMSLALYISAPTGSYDPDKLANVSLNNWSFSPTVAYTQLGQAGTLEFTTLAAMDFYTENTATDYQNGAVFRVDALLIKRTRSGWGFGAAGGWIEQLEDDTGPTADRLNGFKGQSLAIGPIATYKTGKVEFSARWLYEFDVENRLEGNPVLITGTITF